MAKNIKSLQLLRNTNLFADRSAAYNSLSARTTDDGTPVLARYTGTDGNIYTLVGYYATANGTSKAHMTIFDFEGSAADVDKLRQEINARLGDGVTSANTATAQFTALSGNEQSQSGETSVEGAKRYADEKVRAALDALDATTVADDNKIVSDVTQTDGQITATAKNLTAVKLGGYAEGTDADIAATDTLGQALGKLQAQINAMDLPAVSAEGSVITSVSEEDGKVSATATPVKDVKLTGYVKNTAATGDIAPTDDIEDALSKLENKAAAITIANDDKSINVTTSTTGTNINVNIKSGEHVLAKDGNAGLYTNIALSSITPSSTTVREEYQLTATDGSKLGDTIKIYKDSSISKIYLGYSTDTVNEDTGVITSGTTGEAQSLNYVYHKEDGKYEMVHVDVSKFLVESEFASGVTADANGVVHGVVDSTSEKNSGGTAFLTVGTNGFKVDGIKQEIIDRINELDAIVTGGTTAGTATNNHIQVVVGEADGKLTGVTVTETNIADADDLSALSAKTVTEVASSNNSIEAALSAAADGTKHLDIITDASKIKMTGFTSTDVLSGINATSSVTEAFKEVDRVITDNERVVSAALNDLETTKVENINVNGVEGTFSNKVASVTIDGGDVVLGADYAKPAQGSAIATGDTVDQALGKLEAKVDAATSDGITGATVNGAPLAITSNRLTQTVIGKQSEATATSNEAIVVDTDANGNLTLGIASLDAGTY